MGRFVGPAFDADKEATLTLFLYEQTLTELDLFAGELAVVSEPPFRSLPATASIFQTSPDESSWEALSDLPAHFENVHLRATTQDDCLASGGCYADTSFAEQLWCARPCPASTPMLEDVQVAAPTPPMLTWSPAARVPCSGAEVQWVDEESEERR